MKISSINSTSFGKIFVTQNSTVRESLYQQTAYGINDSSVGHFQEKYRLANLSTRYDIHMNENGATVHNNRTNSDIFFDAQIYQDYSNGLYYTLNAAMNYVLMREHGTFASGDNNNK